jgi:membrane protein implicated in regulation of membrane protease activity
MDILESLPPLLQAFWYVAIPTSAIFVIQSILTFMGSDADMELSGDSSSFELFSLRNLINFLLGFSWTGISFYDTISNTTILIGLSISVGVLFVYVFFMIMKFVQKLAQDNSFKLEQTLHKSANVYLTIPENKSGKGKIMISVNGTYHELDAMTEQGRIPTGTAVKVIRIENNQILIVETL